MSASRFSAATLAAALVLAAFVPLPIVPSAGAAALQDTTVFDSHIRLAIDPPHPCNGDTVTLVASLVCPTCLVPINFGFALTAGPVLDLNELAPGACDAAACVPWSRRLPLGRFASGRYAITTMVIVHVPADSFPTRPALAADSTITFLRTTIFDVGDSCGVTPPPGSPPHLTRVTIGTGRAPCDSCPQVACSGDSVPVAFEGAIPDPCTWFVGAHFLPTVDALPGGPIPIELDFAKRCGGPCRVGLLAGFSGAIVLPPQAMGAHAIKFVIAVNTCPDTVRTPVASSTYPYTVEGCGSTTACVMPFLNPLGGDSLSGCTLKLPPGHAGRLHFAARSATTALAGLQGALTASGPVKLDTLVASGAAAGMHLLLSRIPGGFKYVLYAEAGAPIPYGVDAEVLTAGIHADSSAHAGSEGWVAGSVTAASDSLGDALPICPIMTLRVVGARVCIGPSATCDVNGDGAVNVADLVRMARCWLHPETCPDTAAARPDCNGDGAFHLDDILCCARLILSGSADGKGVGQPPAHLSFGFDSPIDLGGGQLEATLVVRGATDMDGALVRLDFPGDRYTLAADPASAGGNGGWLMLSEPGAGDVVLGLLRTDALAADELRVPVRLQLKSGQTPGGSLAIGAGSLTAPDGSTLQLDLSAVTAPLAPGAGAGVTRVELSPASPNPAAGSTRFVVALPAAGDVDLAIFDLAGRRVETLAHGRLDAGRHAFTWQPRGVGGGVYFARLSVGGEVRATRVAIQPAR